LLERISLLHFNVAIYNMKSLISFEIKIIPMKIVPILFLLVLIFASCQSEDEKYTANSVSYNLFQSSDFDYQGAAEVRELRDGGIEVTLRLNGPTSTEAYYFPAHLHFGSYDTPDADIAFLLNPIDIRTLESKTILGKLSDGTSLDIRSFRNFNGHLKIHLADEGPDYSVILATGNVGKNENSIESFSREQLSICVPSYPNPTSF